MFQCTAVTGCHGMHPYTDPIAIITFMTALAPNEPGQQLRGWRPQGRVMMDNQTLRQRPQKVSSAEDLRFVSCEVLGRRSSPTVCRQCYSPYS